jgi:hypothetical protein
MQVTKMPFYNRLNNQVFSARCGLVYLDTEDYNTDTERQTERERDAITSQFAFRTVETRTIFAFGFGL